MEKKAIEPFFTTGEDLNVFVPKPKSTTDFTGLSAFTEDPIKTEEAAIVETKKRTATQWINSEPLLAGYVNENGEAFLIFLDENLKRKIILFEFIDLYNPYSLKSVPYFLEWLKRYEGAGLCIIGIVNSLFPFGTDRDLLEAKARSLGIDFPLVIDADHALWRVFENQWWPRKILFDHSQKTSLDFIGSRNNQEVEKKIQDLLRTTSPGLACPRLMKPLNPKDDQPFDSKISKLFHFGFKKGSIDNKEQLSKEGSDVIFTVPKPKPEKQNSIYLHGPWLGSPHSLYVSSGPYNKGAYTQDAGIQINVTGANVYLVCGSRMFNKSDVTSRLRIQILSDGKPLKQMSKGIDVKTEEGKKTFLYVLEPNIFHVYSSDETKSVNLEILVDPSAADNFEIFAVFATD